MTCLCTGRPPCWVCEKRAEAISAALRDGLLAAAAIARVMESVRLEPGSANLARLEAALRGSSDGQDHHQAHGNGPVSAEEREMDHGDHDGATGAERGEG